MHWLLLIFVILLVVVGPSIWVRRVLAKYSQPADRYPGTGGELARLLLDQLDLAHVKTEKTETGDHYDPQDKVVRLTANNFDGKSLTAITVAAHEVGHAMQDRDGFLPLRLRTQLVRIAMPAQKLGAAILMLVPLVMLITRAPLVSLLLALGGLLSLGATTLVHAVTLPTEFNASFARALPMLEHGEYLKPQDRPHARRLLRAAALTYVSASLMSLLNVARWWAIIRR